MISRQIGPQRERRFLAVSDVLAFWELALNNEPWETWQAPSTPQLPNYTEFMRKLQNGGPAGD